MRSLPTFRSAKFTNLYTFFKFCYNYINRLRSYVIYPAVLPNYAGRYNKHISFQQSLVDILLERISSVVYVQ